MNKKIIPKKFSVPLACMIFVLIIGFSQAWAAGTVKLAYVRWSSEIASSNLVKAVIEQKLGYHCQLVDYRADEMWEAVASGKADATVSVWLPDVHGHYFEQYKDQVVNLGPNLNGTQVGLVVPEVAMGRLTTGTGIRNRPVISVNSIDELGMHSEKFQNRIIGIDPEAGVMKMAQEAIEVYDLNNFRIIDGSEVSMVAELSHAIRHRQRIVVTGWTPHWIFARWELKFLDDPKNVFGDLGHIDTVVRKGLKQDMPKIYHFLDRFNWTPEQMARLMLWNEQEKGLFPYDNALRWLRANQKQVDSWIE